MKDEEEMMTELTDTIHSLFRGYANGFYAHKEAHLKERNLREKLEKENEKLRECVEFYADITRWSGTRIIGDHFKDFENGNASIFISGKLARQTLKELENKE
jgi:hypothetical protein